MTLNTSIRGLQIEGTTLSGGHLIDATIPESKLDINNSTTDGYVLSWNDTDGKMEWVSLGVSTINETPSGLINGSNADFTLVTTPQSGTEMVHLNGLLQESGAGNDYTMSGDTITFIIAPITDDIILVTYLTNDGFASGSFISNVVEDATPQLGGDLDLNGADLLYKPVGDVSDEFSGFHSSLTVDSNATGITAALYVASDGNLEEADASVSGTMPCFGLAMEAGTGTKNVFQQGYVRHDAWDWTVGGILYVSETTGALTQTTPSTSASQVQVVGVATHADRIFFSPNFALAEVA